MSEGDPTSDVDLLNAWVDGDTKASAELIARHYHGILLFFFAKVGPDLAQDLTQATFETLCSKKVAFRGDATVRTFLFGIARWKLVHHHRKHRTQPEPFDPAVHPLELSVAVTSMDSLLRHRREHVLFIQGMRSLALDDQIILELRYYDAMTVRDIAAVYDTPRATMGDRVVAARRRLEAAVKRLGESARLIESTLSGLDETMQGAWRQVAALADDPPT